MAMTVINIYWDDFSKSFVAISIDGHAAINDRQSSMDDLEEKNREPVFAPGPEALISDPPFRPGNSGRVK